MSDAQFHPDRIEIESFQTELLGRAKPGDAARYRFVVALRLHEAPLPAGRLLRATLEAEGFGPGDLSQVDLTRMLLDTLTDAIDDERRGSRPETRSAQPWTRARWKQGG